MLVISHIWLYEFKLIILSWKFVSSFTQVILQMLSNLMYIVAIVLNNANEEYFHHSKSSVGQHTSSVLLSCPWMVCMNLERNRVLNEVFRRRNWKISLYTLAIIIVLLRNSRTHYNIRNCTMRQSENNYDKFHWQKNQYSKHAENVFKTSDLINSTSVYGLSNIWNCQSSATFPLQR
jgi:hypothetical protein